MASFSARRNEEQQQAMSLNPRRRIQNPFNTLTRCLFFGRVSLMCCPATSEGWLVSTLLPLSLSLSVVMVFMLVACISSGRLLFVSSTNTTFLHLSYMEWSFGLVCCSFYFFFVECGNAWNCSWSTKSSALSQSTMVSLFSTFWSTLFHVQHIPPFPMSWAWFQ